MFQVNQLSVTIGKNIYSSIQELAPPICESVSLMLLRDHDPFNGKFRGYANDSCNLKSKEISFMPLYLYNGAKYDKSLTRQPAKSKLKLKLLSKTYEFFSLDIGCIKILDKFRFFSAL